MLLNKDKYKNRKTVDKEDYKKVINIVVFLYTIFFIAVMAMLGYITRSKELIWPISRGQVQYIDKAYAVEVEKYVTPKTIEQKIRATFPEEPDTALAVFKCESGLREKALNTANKNGSWDAGIAQINSVHGVSQTMLLDLEVNLAVARVVYERSGNTFSPWVCYHKLVKQGVVNAK